MSVVIVVFGGLAIYFLKKDGRLKRDDKLKTEGVVIKYSSNNSRAPVVEYRVGNQTYRTSLKYTYVLTTSNPFNNIETNVVDDILDTKLRLRSNSIASINTIMRETFPLGSTLDVYYAADNPRIAYVERYAPSLTGRILMLSTILTLVLLMGTFVFFVI